MGGESLNTIRQLLHSRSDNESRQWADAKVSEEVEVPYLWIVRELMTMGMPREVAILQMRSMSTKFTIAC
jgi:hypothetical protein